MPSGFASRPCPEPYTETDNFSFFVLLWFVGVFSQFTGPRRRRGGGRCCSRRGPAAAPLRRWALSGSRRDFPEFLRARRARGCDTAEVPLGRSCQAARDPPPSPPSPEGLARSCRAPDAATGCARAVRWFGSSWQCLR